MLGLRQPQPGLLVVFSLYSYVGAMPQLTVFLLDTFDCYAYGCSVTGNLYLGNGVIFWLARTPMEISPMGLFGYKSLSKYLIAYHSVCDYVICMYSK